MFRPDSEAFLKDRFIISTKSGLGVSKNSHNAFTVAPKLLTAECRGEKKKQPVDRVILPRRGTVSEMKY